MREALRLAELCKASYDLDDLRFVSVGDMRYGIIEGDLVIRGTDNKRNILRDITAVPWYSSTGVLAHCGFVRAEAKLRAAITPAALASVRRVSGHSFGGSVARLMADVLKVPAVTFGCPRLYFKASDEPGTEHEHHACDDDPVTMIPHLMFKLTPSRRIVHRDRDRQFIDIKDHGIDTYIARLRQAVQALET